jgi:putative ABC transport system substrate-binding protein
VRVPEEFEGALKAAVGQRAGAFFVSGDPPGHQPAPSGRGFRAEIPAATMTDCRERPEFVGLMSFGPDLADSYRRAATYVDKILKGANSTDLPMKQPTRFDLVVNLKTAKAWV